MRRTKILATLGPASKDPDVFGQMLDAGLDAVRVNFSHGRLEDQAQLVEMVREVAAARGKAVPIMQDLQGTKVRIGRLVDGRITLHRGETVRVVCYDAEGDTSTLPVDEPRVVSDASPGGTIVLGDGDVVLDIELVEPEALVCRVRSPGLVREGAGITTTGVRLPGGLTEKDRADLEAGVRLGVDYVALSFVMSADEIQDARAYQAEVGGDAPLVAKIEREEALHELDAIIRAADGILVARGDLGIALPPEQVPIAQKRMLHACAHAGRLAITATQMLESMVTSARPTRAEASDVANAILDGTGVVMLSGETAVGSHPVATVQMMSRIAEAAEQAVYAGAVEAPVHRGVSEGNVADAIALACAVTAEDLDAQAIVAFTRTGITAQRVAKHRPRVPIIAATPDPVVQRRLNLLWGVTAVRVEETDSLDGMVQLAERAARGERLVDSGDLLVLTGGDLGVPGSTNLMRVSQVL